MKRWVGLIVALTLCPAAAEAAGIQLQWNSCLDSPGAADSVRFDCNTTGGSVYSLCGTFVLDATTPDIIAMDGVVDVTPNTPALPAFWHLESGGCNESGLAISDARPGTCSGELEDLCGPSGAGCETVITFVPDPGGLSNGKLLFTIYRSAPATLAGQPARQFAMRLQMGMVNAGQCGGCSEKVRFTWDYATFFSPTGPLSPQSVITTVTAADPDSRASVTASGDSVPVGARTWGRLKALYR
jgi:hypothetical protein